MDEVTMSCRKCKFFDGRFLCKRRSPQIRGNDFSGIWPEVTINEWCGDFEPKLAREIHKRMTQDERERNGDE